MSLSAAVTATFEAVGAVPFEINVELTVGPGETLVVLGPSGSGKTLLLETIAGYHDADGTVHANGRELTQTPPEARDFGFVFQNYALFPHLTVRENVDFGTRYQRNARNPDELLAELDIAHLADRTPATLSGGEAQRVALARSLAIQPDVLLLDEPLSSLDVPTRESLRADLAPILAEVTSVYVTHNRTTARDLGDRIAVMHKGSFIQTGTPNEVFERPATPFVARFTGSNCVSEQTWGAAVVGRDVSPAASPGDRVSPEGEDGPRLAIRPEHVVLGSGGLKGTVERVTRREAGVMVTIRRGNTTVDAYTTDPPNIGEEITVGFPDEHVTWLESVEEETA